MTKLVLGIIITILIILILGTYFALSTTSASAQKAADQAALEAQERQKAFDQALQAALLAQQQQAASEAAAKKAEADLNNAQKTSTPTSNPILPPSGAGVGQKCNPGCVAGAWCNSNDMMCYESCIAKGSCNDGNLIPRINKYNCDYSNC